MSNTNNTTGQSAPSNAYSILRKGWQVATMGPKPGDDLLAVAHCFGKPGKQSLALAMAMRPGGMTAGQMLNACGAPQNNHRRALVTEGLFTRDRNAGTNDAGHTVYKVALTAKGQKAVAKAAASEAAATANGDAAAPKAAKPKAPRKPRKAKVTAAPAAVDPAPTAPAVTSDTAPVTPGGDAPAAN